MLDRNGGAFESHVHAPTSALLAGMLDRVSSLSDSRNSKHGNAAVDTGSTFASSKLLPRESMAAEGLVEASLPDPPHDARFETRETHVSNDPPRADKKSPASRHSALSKAGKSPKKRSPVGERLWQRPSSIASPGKDTSSARWDQHEGQVPATIFVMRAWAMSRLSGSSLSHILSPPPTSLSMR